MISTLRKLIFEKYSFDIVFIMKLNASLISQRYVVIGTDYMIYNLLDMQELDQYEVLTY